MTYTGLSGRVAIVTGSSRGIGLGIARLLASQGVRVVMNARGAAAVAGSAAQIRATGGDVISVAGDAGDEQDVRRLVDGALTAYGRVDILVNNAALANPSAHFLDIDAARWSEVMRSNLTSVFLCTSAVAHDMVARETRGAIVNISSFGAFRAHRSNSAYDAAKGGIEAFTRAVAVDLAPFGIRVNAVAPGPIRTEDSDNSDEAAQRRALVVPAGRIGLPADVAEAVCFLASDAASFITGQCIVVDGGVLAQLRPSPLDTPGPDVAAVVDRERRLLREKEQTQ